jgi:hypothetical protein
MSALLKKNDLGPVYKKKYGPLGSVHRWPPPFSDEPLSELLKSKEDNRFIYIWRNWHDVSLSLLHKEKTDLRLNRMDRDLSLNDFSSTPWAELIKNGSIQAPLLNRWIMKDQSHMTPYESWKEHVEEWLSFSEHRTDVYAVRYEGLMSNFQSTMSNMARWLGSDREDFENISKKVDPAGVRPGGFRGK